MEQITPADRIASILGILDDVKTTQGTIGHLSAARGYLVGLRADLQKKAAAEWNTGSPVGAETECKPSDGCGPKVRTHFQITDEDSTEFKTFDAYERPMGGPRLQIELPVRTPVEYDFVCSIGEIVDKLSIENCKIMFWNEGILTERRGNNDAKVIADLEWKVRQSGELRVHLRAAINQRLKQAVESRSYQVVDDSRTYDLRGLTQDEKDPNVPQHRR